MAQAPIHGEMAVNLSRFGFFRTAFTPHRRLAAASSFDHGYEDPTTERPRRRNLGVERRRRSLESHEGDRKRYTCQGRLWFRQCASRDDQGIFRPVPQ